MRYFNTIDKDKKPADYFSKFIFDLIMVLTITGSLSASESGPATISHYAKSMLHKRKLKQ